jgi:hypothetical protein
MAHLQFFSIIVEELNLNNRVGRRSSHLLKNLDLCFAEVFVI